MTELGVPPGRMAESTRDDRTAPWRARRGSSRRWPSWLSNSTSWSSVVGRAATRPRCTAPPPGLNIAMVEERRVGGTCLHRGCIPAKELLQTAEVLRTVQRAPEFGVDAGEPTLDLAPVAGAQAGGRRPADQGPRVAAQGPQGHRVRLGAARSPTPPRARSASPTAPRCRATTLVIATGSEPRSLPGLDFDGTRVLSSDHVLELDRGAGAGRDHRRRRDRLRVRVVARRHRQRGHAARGAAAHPRRPTDVDAGNVVARSFKKRGIKVQTGARVTGIEGARELTVTWETDAGEQSAVVDKVVVSVGRRAAAARASGSKAPASRSTSAASSSSTASMRTNVDGRVRGRRRRRHAAARARRLRRGDRRS